MRKSLLLEENNDIMTYGNVQQTKTTPFYQYILIMSALTVQPLLRSEFKQDVYVSETFQTKISRNVTIYSPFGKFINLIFSCLLLLAHLSLLLISKNVFNIFRLF